MKERRCPLCGNPLSPIIEGSARLECRGRDGCGLECWADTYDRISSQPLRRFLGGQEMFTTEETVFWVNDLIANANMLFGQLTEFRDNLSRQDAYDNLTNKGAS